MVAQAKPAVVLLSGGMDSAALLHHVARTLGRTPIHALSYDYGQRHSREWACAAWQAQAAGVAEHRVIDLGFVKDLVKSGTTLVEGGDAVPDLEALGERDLDQPPTYVPNRNMMLLSLAVAYAEARGVRDVFYGAQAQDEYGYWDCTAEYIERLNHVLALNRRDSVTIQAPFVGMRKGESLKIGLDLGVDYAHTWSCYRGGETAWTYALDRGPPSAMAAAPDGGLYVLNDSRRVTALDAGGGERWRFEANVSLREDLVVAMQGWLLLQAAQEILALEPNGELRWRHALEPRTVLKCAVTESGRIYVAARQPASRRTP